MEKKEFYVRPEMEEINVNLENLMGTVSGQTSDCPSYSSECCGDCNVGESDE